jgi:hypothetical protein
MGQEPSLVMVRSWGILNRPPRHMTALAEDSWPIEERPRIEEREGQLTACQKGWIYLVFTR